MNRFVWVKCRMSDVVWAHRGGCNAAAAGIDEQIRIEVEQTQALRALQMDATDAYATL